MTIYNKSLSIQNDTFSVVINNYDKLKKLVEDWKEIQEAVQDYIVIMGGSDALVQRVKEIEGDKK